MIPVKWSVLLWWNADKCEFALITVIQKNDGKKVGAIQIEKLLGLTQLRLSNHPFDQQLLVYTWTPKRESYD